MKSARFSLVSFVVLLLPIFISVSPLAAQNVSVYASGLNGPRGLKFGPDGALYVAEAGLGGSTPSTSFDCELVPPRRWGHTSAVRQRGFPRSPAQET